MGIRDNGTWDHTSGDKHSEFWIREKISGILSFGAMYFGKMVSGKCNYDNQDNF